MSMNVYVISAEPSEYENLRADDVELREVLGRKEEAIAVQLKELFDAVINSMRSSLSHESELILELNGSVELKADAGVQWLFFNVGAGAKKTNVMKVTLKTKIEPNAG